MALKYLNAQELERWKQSHPGGQYYDEVGNPQVVASTTKDLGFLGNLVRTLSKPVRVGLGAAQEAAYTFSDLLRLAKGENTEERHQKYFGLTEEESKNLYEDPMREGIKAAAGLMSYAVPAGAAGKATTTGGRIGSAALRGAGAGTLGGLGYSETGKELESALTGAGLGAVLGGALQGTSELTQKIKAGKAPEVINTLDIDEISQLPKSTRSGLVKQAKSAGMWDSKLSESANIKNFLKSRGFAGKTPAETLENMTQQFNTASKLKQEGLEEIGGMSRSYLEQVKNNLDDAIRYKGINLDAEGTKVYRDIIKTLEKGPQSAKELDKIIMQWNEAGRLAKGAQKTNIAGLYADAARELRNAMRSTSPTYDTALRALDNILGTEKAGVVSKAAQATSKTGLRVPFVSGTAVKTPVIPETISKVGSTIGKIQETGSLGLPDWLLQALQTTTQVGQMAIPAAVGLTQQETVQPTQDITQGLLQGPTQVQQAQPQTQGISAINMMLAQGILNGQISASEAEAVLNLLGMGKSTSQVSQGQMDAQNAIDMVNRLSQSIATTKKTGPIKGLSTLSPYATEALDLQAQIDLARQVVGKFLEGGVLRKEDEEKYKKILPTMYDTPEVAQRKLRNLAIELQNRMAQYEATGYSGYGQNPYSAIDELGLY